MPLRLFANAVASSTCASAINASQTSITLQSTSGFLVPAAGQQFSATILDSGNPAFNANSPLATPYEYVYATGNNQGTNTLTVSRGVGGTSGRAFFAGATVSQTFLADDINASFPIKFDEQAPTGTSFNLAAVPTWARLVVIEWAARTNSANVGDTLSMRFNSDVGTTYDYTRSVLGGTYATTGQTLNQSSAVVGIINGGGAAAIPASGTTKIFYPNLTGYRRSYISVNVRADSTNGTNPEMAGGDWQNTTNAISTITFLLSAGSFVGSTFAAYAYP